MKLGVFTPLFNNLNFEEMLEIKSQKQACKWSKSVQGDHPGNPIVQH